MWYTPESCLVETATHRSKAGSDHCPTQCQAGEEADTKRLLVRKTEFEEKVQARYEMERLPVWEADFEDLWP